MRLSGWVLVGALACLVAMGCQSSGDGDQPGSCPECECEDYCIALCQHVEAECGGTRVRACTEGCFVFEPAVCPLDSVEDRPCMFLDDEAACYEAIGSEEGDCTTGSLTPPGLCDPSQPFECGLGAYCDADTMRCVPGCRTDSECPSSQYCETDTMQCMAGCTEDFDCEGNDICNLETHTCEGMPCEEQRDCPFDTTCNPASQRCEPCSATSCDGMCDQFGRCVECLETTDCPATHECSANACRQRCNAMVPCEASRVCSAGGLCSDPIGGPCDPDAPGSCFGGRCLDEDASLMTVEPYCAPMCTIVTSPAPGFSCPAGFVCQTFDCVRQ